MAGDRGSPARGGRGARAVAALLVLGALAVVVMPERLAPVLGGAGPDPAQPTAAAPVPTVPVAEADAVGASGVSASVVGASAADAPAAPTVPDATPAELRLVEVRGGWRTEEDLGTAAAVAMLVGTTHLAALDPRGRTPVLAVEAVEQPGPGAAVVTLLVAPRAGTDRNVAAPSSRLVVPLALGPGGVRVAGTPWVLPGPPLAPAPPTGRPVSDPDLLEAARAALDRAGLDGAALTGLDATDGWPFRVRFAGDAEGPWLRWHLDRFVVTGLPLHRAAGMGAGTEVP